MNRSEISVVICTCRRAESLRRTLQSLAECQRPEGLAWEVVVVDNAPAGEVERLVGEFASALPVRCVAEPEPGLSNARNRGVAESRGEVVWFIDDDVWVDPGWLRAVCEATAAHPEAASFAGRVLPDWCGAALPAWLDTQSLGAFVGVFVQNDPGGPARPLKPGEVPIGANMGFRRSVFGKVGGFRSDLGAFPGGMRLKEDTELGYRVQEVVPDGWYVATGLVRHMTAPSRLTPKYALRWAFANGRDAAHGRAISRTRQGRDTIARRARDIFKHVIFLLGRLPLAATVGWFMGSRGRMALWMSVATDFGSIAGTFGPRADLSLDWPNVIRSMDLGARK